MSDIWSDLIGTVEGANSPLVGPPFAIVALLIPRPP